MASSALHAIAVTELQHTKPAFYREYTELVRLISEHIRDLAQKHGKALTFTSFTEAYDHLSNEPFLQIAIGVNQKDLHLQIYIHKDHHFVIGKSGSGKVARTAKHTLDLVVQKLNEMGA